MTSTGLRVNLRNALILYGVYNIMLHEGWRMSSYVTLCFAWKTQHRVTFFAFYMCHIIIW